MKIKFRTWDKEIKKFQSVNVWKFSGYKSTTEQGRREIILDPSIHMNEGADRFIINVFTGLVDKNGKEIYEGDILKCPWGFKPEHFSCGFVVFQNGSFKLAKREEKDKFLKQYGYYNCYGFNDTPTRVDLWSEAEIVGNIHENPELLKLIKNE